MEESIDIRLRGQNNNNEVKVETRPKPQGILTERLPNNFLSGRGRGLYRNVPPPTRYRSAPPLKMADTIRNAPKVPLGAPRVPILFPAAPAAQSLPKVSSILSSGRTRSPTPSKKVTFNTPETIEVRKLAPKFPPVPGENKENVKPTAAKKSTMRTVQISNAGPISKQEWQQIYTDHISTGHASKIHSEVN